MKVPLLAAATFILSVHLAGTCIAEGTSYSGRAVKESARAASHASAGAMYGGVASGQFVSAAAALPLAVGGSLGALSARTAAGLMDAATAPVGTPLPISDEIVTAGPPPDQALKSDNL